MGLISMPRRPRDDGSQDQQWSQDSEEWAHYVFHCHHNETPRSFDFVCHALIFPKEGCVLVIPRILKTRGVIFGAEMTWKEQGGAV